MRVQQHQQTADDGSSMSDQARVTSNDTSASSSAADATTTPAQHRPAAAAWPHNSETAAHAGIDADVTPDARAHGIGAKAATPADYSEGTVVSKSAVADAGVSTGAGAKAAAPAGGSEGTVAGKSAAAGTGTSLSGDGSGTASSAAASQRNATTAAWAPAQPYNNSSHYTTQQQPKHVRFSTAPRAERGTSPTSTSATDSFARTDITSARERKRRQQLQWYVDSPPREMQLRSSGNGNCVQLNTGVSSSRQSLHGSSNSNFSGQAAANSSCNHTANRNRFAHVTAATLGDHARNGYNSARQWAPPAELLPPISEKRHVAPAEDDVFQAAQRLFAPADIIMLGNIGTDANDDAVLDHYIEVAKLEANVLPLPQLASRAHISGYITVDANHRFRAHVRSASSQQKVCKNDILLDTGAKVSCVSVNFLRQMLRSGAARRKDVQKLEKPRSIIGCSTAAAPEHATQVVSLMLHADGKNGVTFTHTFIAVPNLGYDIIVGRDFLLRQTYSAHGEPQAGTTYAFGDTVEVARNRGGKTSTIVMQPSTRTDATTGPHTVYAFGPSCDWCVVVRAPVPTAANLPYQHALIQVMHSDGVTPVTTPAALAHQHVYAELRHPLIVTQGIVLGLGCTPVLLQMAASEGTIPHGTIIGSARVLHEQQGAELVVTLETSADTRVGEVDAPWASAPCVDPSPTTVDPCDVAAVTSVPTAATAPTAPAHTAEGIGTTQKASQQRNTTAQQRNSVREQLAQQLGAGVTFDAQGQPTAVPPNVGGTPLSTYVHRNAAVNAVLRRARKQLPEHVQRIRVDMKGWTAHEVEEFCNILAYYADSTFSADKWDVGSCTTLPFKVELRQDAKPVRERPYRYSPRMTELVRVEIDKLLAAGIIRPSLSEWASPVVAVLKPDGTARITVNYRKLNAQTVVPQIPLPNIEDLLNSLGGSRIFTTMDVTSGYFTSAIDADTIPLTAMVTSFGLYEWTRCPQGAAGAPGHFTRLMEMVLRGLERVQPFIDDIIAHSTSVKQHLSDLRKLFQRLAEHGMKLAPAKVHVGCEHVKFLGHVIGVDGIRPDPDKVSALLNMPMPGNLQQLRSWLGLASYYRRFVRNMSKIVAPLTKLMSKGAAFVMGPEQQQAIRDVNETLALHTLMRYPDHQAAHEGTRPFVLATDACKDGFGAVLSQADEAGVEQPIAFASRATLSNEKNWSTTDLEAGAIVFGIKKFRHILWGTPFVLHTDHRALQFMDSLREKTARGARWNEFLAAFQHTVRYKKGTSHGNADAPSRNPIPASDADIAEEQREQLLEAYCLSDSECTQAAVLTLAWSEFADIVMAVEEAFEAAADEHAAASIAAADGFGGSEHMALHPQLGMMTAHQWQQLQRADDELSLIISCLQGLPLPAQPAGIAATVQRMAADCQLREIGNAKVLVHLQYSSADTERQQQPLVQLAIPKAVRDQLLDSMHGSAWAGHQGRRKTLARVKQHAWWPSYIKDTVYWVDHCWACQARKRVGKLNKWPLVWRDRPPFPFHTVGVDFFGPLPPTVGGHSYILVFVDLYSAWVELYPVTAEQANAEGVAEVLVCDYATRHGVPLLLLSDRGAPFMAELSRQVYLQMGIHKLSTTPFHPQTNGKTERFMQSLAQMLSMVADSAAADWHRWLRHVTFAYNSSEHASTGASPFLLAMGREPRIALHSILGCLQRDPQATSAGTGVHDLIVSMMQRQRAAEAVVDRRQALRQAHVLQHNAAIAAAFGFRQQFKRGDRVWVYRETRTHQAHTSQAERDEGHGNAKITFSRKLLDKWNGPYEVLRVGPYTGDGIKVQHNCLLVNINGRATRVSAQQCKTCKDPGRLSSQPETLPTGFAKYLLAKCWSGLSPGSLTADDVRAERHGVEAVLRHRLVSGARGRGRKLQYLVRWEGESGSETWEPAHFLDACPDALQEYWSVTAHSDSVEGSTTPVVREQLRRARKQSGIGGTLAVCSRGAYTLSPAAVALKSVTAAQLKSTSVAGMGLLQVYTYNEGTHSQFIKWCEGVIKRTPQKKGRTHRVYWYEGCTHSEVLLRPELYSTSADASSGSWFLFGTAEQIAHL